ncbi:MAG: Rrf2 family transcriptional regulator [Caldicoprobacter oshimai]|uniref:Transcriptional regulator, BadM/Rrf2 family n=1 Tax=Caldicoprobacter faecalis TaxID=937334 RepID=A0A1I5YM26_9FIRM|nr:Rrf2 family transcriptional regulator [Caldicoprobacter faecalis]PZN09435.1 MAG: Rrf2 family transcriptional regulator [Caldicoprobacter oshimai]SFQ45319.1 transcriptional regulator, BadM/Rrf2 family [Caldicoprobacter faecalis]
MTISTRGRYGVKAMLDLALNSSQDSVPVKSIAERQNIPGKYLEQVLSALKKAGLVKSVRGPTGGYMLAKPPEHITVGDILRALEGDLAPVKCVEQGQKKEKCARERQCITKYVWARIRDEVNQVVDSITLKDLADAYEKEVMNGYMYYI